MIPPGVFLSTGAPLLPSIVFACLLLLSVQANLSAQESETLKTRGSYWISGDLGIGTTGIACGATGCFRAQSYLVTIRYVNIEKATLEVDSEIPHI